MVSTPEMFAECKINQSRAVHTQHDNRAETPVHWSLKDPQKEVNIAYSERRVEDTDSSSCEGE